MTYNPTLVVTHQPDGGNLVTYTMDFDCHDSHACVNDLFHQFQTGKEYPCSYNERTGVLQFQDGFFYSAPGSKITPTVNVLVTGLIASIVFYTKI